MKLFFRKATLFVPLFLILWSLSGKQVMAAPFTKASIRYDRMKQNTPTSLQVVVVPATTGTEGKLKLILNAATIGAGISAGTAAIPSGSTGMPGSLSASRVGTTEIDIVVGDLTVGTTYAVNITVGVSTPAGASSSDVVRSTTSGDSLIDETKITSAFITDDQIVITGNVPPTFTFSLSGNTDAFTADLSSSSVVSTAGRSVSVSTNAAKGWIGWVKSTNAALSSATTGESIATAGTVNGSTDTCSNGVDCYVLDVGVTAGTGSGSLAADSEYAGNGTTSGGTLSTTYQPFAARSGKTNGDTIWLRAHVSMIATKAAGSDYTDTWTVIGAGQF